MLLRQQGKLNLDDLATQNIPGAADSCLPATPQCAIPYKDQMTIRQMLSHRAGIFDLFNDPVPKISKEPYAGQTYGAYMSQFSGPDHQFTVDELAGVLSANQLSFFKPGTDYHYSDTGYNLLVKIVERVSGTDFTTFVAKNLLGPIGLPQTSVISNAYDSGLPTPFMTGYVNAVQYDPKQDVSVVVVTPFIDYTQPLDGHLAFLTDAGKQVRQAAGYSQPWTRD